MSNYMNAKGDTMNDSLQHGLGKGSGRGRPLGSKNGQVMPGAAYMKDYQPVGEKAQWLNNLNNQANRNNAANRAVGSPINTRAVGNTANRSTANTVGTRVKVADLASKVNDNSQTSTSKSYTPTEKVSNGANFVNNLMNSSGGDSTVDQTEGNASGNNPRATLKKNLEAAKEAIKNEKSKSVTPNGQSMSTSGAGDVQPIDVKPIDIETSQDNTAPAEEPEEKGLLDRIGSWFSQAAVDVGDTLVGAWNDTKSAVSDAWNEGTKWVNDRLNEAGSWASTAVEDVGKWAGDTWNSGVDTVDRLFGTDLNNNGVTGQAGWQGAERALQNAGQWLDQNIAQPVSRAANDVGQWVGNTAGAIGTGIGNAANDVNRFFNGYDAPVNDQTGRNIATQHVNGFWDNAGNWISTAAGNIGQGISNAANDVGSALGNVGQGVRNAAVGASDWLLGGYEQIGTDANGNPIWSDQRRGGIVNDAADALFGRYNQEAYDRNGLRRYGNIRRGGLLNDVADTLAGRYREMGQDEYGNTIYGNQRYGGIANDAADAMFGQYEQTGVDEFGRPTYEGSSRSGGPLLPVANAAVEGWNNFVVPTANAVGESASNIWNNGVVPAANAVAEGAANLWNRNVQPALSDPVGTVSAIVNGGTGEADRYTTAISNARYQKAAEVVPGNELQPLAREFARGNIDEMAFYNELARLDNLYRNVYNQ